MFLSCMFLRIEFIAIRLFFSIQSSILGESAYGAISRLERSI